MKRNIILSLFILCCLFTQAQTSGDYRSAIAAGLWSSPGSWERFNGAGWAPAATAPTSSDGVITIMNGHSITVSSNVIVDNLNIANGGTLTVNSSIILTLANGAGTDMYLNTLGTFINNGTLNTNTNSTILAYGFFKYSGTVTLGNNSNITLPGVLELTGNTGIITLGAGGSSFISITPTGRFQHNANGGLIPSAIWQIGSTCEIKGYTTSTTAPGGLNQAFDNFIWNCTSQTSHLDLGGDLTAINGNFSFSSSGSGSVSLTSSDPVTFDIGNDMLIQGGTFILSSGSAIPVVNVFGNYSQTGGTLEMAGLSATGNAEVYLDGNFDITVGNITENSAANSGIFYIKGSSNQALAMSGGVISNNINFTLDNANGAILQNNLIIPSGATLTLKDGILDLNGKTLTMNANSYLARYPSSSVSSSPNWLGTGQNGPNLIYMGSAVCTTSVELPTNTASITNNNTTTVVLNKSIVCESAVTLNTGTFQLNGFSIIGSSTAVVTRNSAATISAAIGGSWSNLIYTGTSAIVTGPEFKSALTSLSINNTNGVTLTGALSISSDLIFSTAVASNHLRMGNFNVSIASGASITNASSSRYIMQSGTGTLSRGIAANTVLFFPLGENTGTTEYTPARLTFNSGTYSSAVISVRLENSKHSQNISAAHYINRYWAVNQSGISSFSCDVTFTYADGDVVGTESNLYGGKYTASKWYLLNAVNAATNGISGTTTTFSDFTAGEINAVPVTMLSFTGTKLNDQEVRLDWATATEISNRHFEIERSLNGKDFTRIGTVGGKINSYTRVDYVYFDKNLPAAAVVYYRLKQVDLDNKFTYTNSVVITSEDFKSNQITFNNPFVGSLNMLATVADQTNITLNVTDLSGSKIITENVSLFAGTNNIQLTQTAMLPAGVYFVQYELNNEIKVLKLIKQ